VIFNLFFITTMSEKKNSEVNLSPIEMLNRMYQEIKGTNLLLEVIQPDANENIPIEDRNHKKRHKMAFKTLIATILSVRTKDETTLQVIEDLWQTYSNPKDLSEAPIEKLEEIVYSTGFYSQKAKRIKETARIIHEKYDDKVPDEMKKLLELPGVGRKVANCVLSISFSKDVVAVDTHVHRISNRTGWVDTKSPKQTEMALQKVFPKKLWGEINYTLVSFGKNICRPTNPKCDECPVGAPCEKLIEKTRKKRRKKKRKDTKKKEKK